MCLIMSKYSRPFIATKDIIVYKVFLSDGKEAKVVRSPYQGFDYIVGKKYKTDITIFNGFYGGFDGDDTSYAIKKWGDEWENSIKSISTGFHSSKTRKRLEGLSRDFLYTTYTYECIIPKGAVYYVGVTDLIVSDQIIVSKYIQKNRQAG